VPLLSLLTISGGPRRSWDGGTWNWPI